MCYLYIMNILDIFSIYVVVIFVMICGSIYLYVNDNKLFIYITQIITVISTVTIMFSLVSSSFAQYKIESHDSIDGYASNLQLFLNDVFNLFLNKPHMIYMYNEMMDIRSKQPKLRYKNEENLIGCYIFANCAKVTAFIYESKDTDDVNRIKTWLTKVLTTYLKSPILVGVWKTEYKPKLAGPLLTKFMADTFSM